MAGRARFVSRVSKGPRRKTAWISFGPNLFLIPGVSTALLNFTLNAAALALRPFTIVRTRGSLFYRSDQVAASESYGGGFGIAVVSDQAAAIGITAIPTPVTDFPSEKFFVIEQMNGRIDVATSVGIDDTGRERLLDSKAMRKVDISEDIVVTMETASFHTSLQMVQAFRILVKLH